MERLHQISDFSMMALFHGKPAQKIVSGELLYRIINDMISVKAGNKTMPTKMMMYSSVSNCFCYTLPNIFGKYLLYVVNGVAFLSSKLA